MGRNKGGRDFKAGRSGNPKGRPRLPADIKEARKLNRQDFEKLLGRYMKMSRSELVSESQRSDASIMEVMIASIINKGIVHGDQKRLDFILNRLIGTVKEQIEISGEGGGPLDVYLDMTDEERTQKRLALERRLGLPKPGK